MVIDNNYRPWLTTPLPKEVVAYRSSSFLRISNRQLKVMLEAECLKALRR